MSTCSLRFPPYSIRSSECQPSVSSMSSSISGIAPVTRESSVASMESSVSRQTQNMTSSRR